MEGINGERYASPLSAGMLDQIRDRQEGPHTQASYTIYNTRSCSCLLHRATDDVAPPAPFQTRPWSWSLVIIANIAQ